jgi:hypothetical protein
MAGGCAVMRQPGHADRRTRRTSAGGKARWAQGGQPLTCGWRMRWAQGVDPDPTGENAAGLRGQPLVCSCGR